MVFPAILRLCLRLASCFKPSTNWRRRPFLSCFWSVEVGEGSRGGSREAEADEAGGYLVSWEARCGEDDVRRGAVLEKAVMDAEAEAALDMGAPVGLRTGDDAPDAAAA